MKAQGSEDQPRDTGGSAVSENEHDTAAPITLTRHTKPNCTILFVQNAVQTLCTFRSRYWCYPFRRVSTAKEEPYGLPSSPLWGSFSPLKAVSGAFKVMHGLKKYSVLVTRLRQIRRTTPHYAGLKFLTKLMATRSCKPEHCVRDPSNCTNCENVESS